MHLIVLKLTTLNTCRTTLSLSKSSFKENNFLRKPSAISTVASIPVTVAPSYGSGSLQDAPKLGLNLGRFQELGPWSLLWLHERLSTSHSSRLYYIDNDNVVVIQV